MSKKDKVQLSELEALIFDFDGVLTDNRVYVNEHGDEFVACHRGDGLAFRALNNIGIKIFIISSEKNKVVTARATKLGVEVIQGVSEKTDVINSLVSKENIELDKVLYTGNDLNDLRAMELCGFSACPSDSHQKIISHSDFILKSNGGMGVVRELVEEVLNIDMMLYI